MNLIKVIDAYKDKVPDVEKFELSQLGSVDSPPIGLLEFDKAVEHFNPKPGDTIVALVKVGDIWSDPKYNRTERIHYKNISKNLRKCNGFSYKACGIISLFLRPNNQLVTTKGNHRTTKRFATTLNPDSLIPAEITFHKEEIDYDSMICQESSDHHFDCNLRTSQNADDKFKAAYYAKEKETIILYNYLDQFSIGVAGTNNKARFSTTSHNYIAQAKSHDQDACSRYLKAFTDNLCEEFIGGNATLAGTIFVSTFQESIKFIDENNQIDSIKGFLEYIYKDRYAKSSGYLENVTQSKLTEGNATFKGPEINVARLISLYNEYCSKVIKAKIPSNNNHAIGYSSNEYTNFVRKSDEVVRIRVDELARSVI